LLSATKTKLMQKIVTKTALRYKWVVEDLCPACDASCAAVAIVPGAVVPAPPVTDAKVVPGFVETVSLTTP
jgi:hypothetical protein